MAVHFVGFRGSEFQTAVKIFGSPDFIHRHWDVRAKQEAVPEDVVVFAKGTEISTPNIYSFNDSQVF
jgi:hypothetical protein